MISGDRPPRRPFRHGTTYYHFANPPEEWQRIFRSMRSMGIDCVRVAEIWPGWEVLEPAPGRMDLGELDRFVDTAVAEGLDVIMGLGIDNPPAWTFEQWPDLRCVDGDGRVASRRVQAANHDHPGYRISANLDTHEWALVAQPRHGDHA